jgi:hypothetical protein
MYTEMVAACIRHMCGGYAEPHTQNLDPEKFIQFSVNAHGSIPFKVIFMITG